MSAPSWPPTGRTITKSASPGRGRRCPRWGAGVERGGGPAEEGEGAVVRDHGVAGAGEREADEGGGGGAIDLHAERGRGCEDRRVEAEGAGCERESGEGVDARATALEGGIG